MRTGISRYRKSVDSGSRSTAGFSGSIVSSARSLAHGLDPVEQELRVERHDELAAVELRLDRLVGLTDVLCDRRQLEAVGGHVQPDRRGVAALAHEPDPVHRRAQDVARHRQPVRISGRDELLVVREVALDERVW